MRIDVVIDTVCPWCYVGKRRLEEGMDLRSDQEFEVLYHPFLLAPEMPREGKDRQQHFEEKFGKAANLEKMTQALKEQAGDIDFQFEAIKRVPNTVDSHRLIRWAQAQGLQQQIVDVILKAYFTDAQDIGSPAVLTALASSAGMDAEAVAAHLAKDDGRDVIQQLAVRARGMGVTGVPFYVFDGRIALSGAQPAQVIAQAIDKALDTQAA